MIGYPSGQDKAILSAKVNLIMPDVPNKKQRCQPEKIKSNISEICELILACSQLQQT